MKFFTTFPENVMLKNTVLLLVRVFTGFAMISHGFPKLQSLLNGGNPKFYDFLGLGPDVALPLAVFAEFVCSIFLILGLFTRPALLFLIITMCVAAFGRHWADPFDVKESALMYLMVYLLLFVNGPGRYSVDGMLAERRNNHW